MRNDALFLVLKAVGEQRRQEAAGRAGQNHIIRCERIELLEHFTLQLNLLEYTLLIE